MLGPLSQSKLSYYSNTYLQQQNKQQQQQLQHRQQPSPNMKKPTQTAQQNNALQQTAVNNVKTSNTTTLLSNKNYYQQQHLHHQQQQQNAMRSNSNASELKTYDQYDDVDEYYPPHSFNKNATTKSKLPLPALQKNQPAQAQQNNGSNGTKVVLKQQNVNLNMDNLILKKQPTPENEYATIKKRPEPVDPNHLSRKTSESFYNLNPVNPANNGKIPVKKKPSTNKSNLFSPENSNVTPINAANAITTTTSNTTTNNTNGHVSHPVDHLAVDLNQRQRSISLMNAAHPIHTKSRLTSSTRLSINSSLTSSCSSILNSIEETENLYDLSDLIKKYLNKVEKEFSLEKLHAFVKTNIKYNGYRNFTLDALEAHLAPISNLGKF